MTLAFMQSWWNGRTGWEKAAITLWFVVMLAICGRSYVRPTVKTVYPIYSASGAFWVSGTDLYAPDRPEWAQGGYRYSPTFAVLCVPFSVLPDDVGGVLWRLACTAGLLGSLVWLARKVSIQPMTPDQVAWLLLLCLPLSLQSVGNGQANILIAATLVAAAAAVMEERWNLVSLLVAVAFACKVYPLAFGMLLMVLYPRRLGWRIPLAVAGSLLLPFLLQSPDYVVDQYAKWFAALRRDDRSAIALDQAYRDLWLLIRLYDVPIRASVYLCVQLLSAAGIAVWVWTRQRMGWPEKPLLISTLALAAAWMMLLGPTTESCSFILLAPSLSWSIVDAIRNGASKWRLGLLGACGAYFVVAIGMADFKSIINIHAVGLHSWASVFYFIFLLTEPRKSVKEAPAVLATRRLAA